jgi:putative pyruvate formate lyase activating enzyme
VRDGGAGTIFFSGCNLGCVFCQNRAISRGGCGEIMSEGELEGTIFSLIEQGASCIEFVTPTHYTAKLASLLGRIKGDIPVPVVWNSGGYESVESLRMLDGLIDIYMPDFKYFSPELSKKYSNAEDYAAVATGALHEQIRQVGKPQYGDGGMLLRGVIVRHLILPSHRADSVGVLELIANEVGAENVILSLMGQYTPDFYIEHEKEHGKNEACKNLRRRLTSFEYDSVLSRAIELGFDGYFQSLDSASKKFTPDF